MKLRFLGKSTGRGSMGTLTTGRAQGTTRCLSGRRVVIQTERWER